MAAPSPRKSSANSAARGATETARRGSRPGVCARGRRSGLQGLCRPQGKSLRRTGHFFRNHVLPEDDHRSRIAGAASRNLNADRRTARNSGPGAAAETYFGITNLFQRFRREGRGRFSSGERRQTDARRRDRFPALHAGGHHGIAGALRRENRRRGSRGARAAATSSANRWRRCFARRAKAPTPP